MAATSEMQDNCSEEKPTDEMKSQVSSTDDNVKLEDLKICDIKNELEKRELDKNGGKTVLIERLKTAIVEEGENPEEYKFKINSDSIPVKSISVEVKADVPETNGVELVNDEINNAEEKQEVALQLSLDEEEAQLNDESLVENTKHTEVEGAKEECVDPLNNDIPEEEKSPLSDKESIAPKDLKIQQENAKEKNMKVLEQSKTGESTSTISPKILKVIGKAEKLKSSNILAKSLWVTGLPNTTRAADLTALFSKQGKVLSVKIVKSAKQTPAKCYGIVTMGTSKDATKAIQNLHRTELNGRIISVERKQGEAAALLKKSETKTVTSTTKKGTKKDSVTSKQISNTKDSVSVKCKQTSKVDNKDEEKKLNNEESNKKSSEKIVSSEKSKEKERKSKLSRERVAHRSSKRSTSFKPRVFGYNERPHYDNFRRPFNRRPLNNRFNYYSSFRPRSSLINFQKLREERFQREKLRERRDAEHRREDEFMRHRYIERKQREEAYRLEREKEKLRIERELLERERAEIIKLEREKQRLERVQLECEREELRRQTEFRRSSKRPFSRVDRNPDLIWEERKKSRYDIRPAFRGEASGSSRYEYTPRERENFSREYERHPEKYSSEKHMDVISRSDLGDRDARREITIRPREDRQVFARSDFRDNRRNLPSRERDRHSSSRSDWKQDRRVQEREISSNSAAGQRRMTYY